MDAANTATVAITCKVTYDATNDVYSLACTPKDAAAPTGVSNVQLVFTIDQTGTSGGWTFQPVKSRIGQADYYFGITIFNDPGVEPQFDDAEMSQLGRVVTLTDLNSNTTKYTYAVVLQNLGLQRLVMVDPTIKNNN